jgi:hypothetical protein
MNPLSQLNQQVSDSRPTKLAHKPDEPALQYSPLLPNPFLGLQPIERENRAAAATTTIIPRPVNRHGLVSPLADKCSNQIEFDFQNSFSRTERGIWS